MFQKYVENISLNINGMDFLKLIKDNLSLTEIGFPDVVITSHYQYILNSIFEMYTPIAKVCPAKFYCLHKVGYL